MAQEDFLEQRATIQLQASVQDAAGGLVRDPYTPALANIPCLLREMGGDNQPRHDRAALQSTHVIYFDRNYQVTTKHEIKIGNRIFNPTSSTDFNSMGRLVGVGVIEVVE